MLKKMILLACALAAPLMLTGCIDKVKNGETAVVVNMMGSGKGVDPVERGVGWVFLTPNEELFKFPTFNQNFNLGVVAAQDKDGMKLTFPLGMTVRAAPGSAPLLFKTYRKGMPEIVGVNVPQVIRTSMNNAASKLSAEDMFGPGKEAFLKDVEDRVRNHFATRGIIVESLYINGEIGLPVQIADSIEKKIEATQAAQRKVNELAGANADADKIEAEARGKANAITAVATAEAAAIALKGKALRDNPGVVELNAIDKWDGKMPTMMGGNGPLPFINVK